MVMCAPDCRCKWCRLQDMAVHPLFQESVEELLEEFKIYFKTAAERQMERLTSLKAQVALHVDDEPAVPEPGLALDAVDVLGDQVKLAAGICQRKT
jgi:hypothetical protein